MTHNLTITTRQPGSLYPIFLIKACPAVCIINLAPGGDFSARTLLKNRHASFSPGAFLGEINMFCVKCKNNISQCVCNDIDERLTKLNSSYIIYKMCKICGKHYDRCICEKPDYTTNRNRRIK